MAKKRTEQQRIEAMLRGQPRREQRHRHSHKQGRPCIADLAIEDETTRRILRELDQTPTILQDMTPQEHRLYFRALHERERLHRRGRDTSQPDSTLDALETRHS